MNEDRLKKLIRQLVAIEPNERPLISCFLDLTPPRNDFAMEIEPKARMIAKRLVGQPKSDFEDAMNEVREYVDRSLEDVAKGLAIYSRWGDEPTFIPVQFEVPLKSMLVVDDLPHIYPLIELKDTYHRFVIVITTEGEARILETTVGAVTEEVFAARPDLRERVGREWTRTHYQNHKKERDQQFVREKIQIIEDLVSRRGHNHIVIAGSPKMVSRLTAALPSRLRSMLIDTIPTNPKGGVSPILLESIQLFAAAENLESHTNVELLESAAMTGGLGVVGYESCRHALENGYADMLILDQNEVELEMREELVRLATNAGIDIETVNRSEALARLSGVGCLLRYRPDFGPSALGTLAA
ncbi:MAG: hypothetical protein AAGA58_03350 [Verrucomicrobiota bacterium]